MVNYHENIYSRRGTEERDHIPALPFWMAIIRVVQLVFAFIVLVLTAYASATFGKGVNGNYVVDTFLPGYNFGFFAFAWTVLFFIYIFLTPLVFPKFYHSYAHIPLEFLTALWWLTTFALLADEIKWFVAEQNSIESAKDFAGDFGRDSGSLDDELAAAKASRAATGLTCIVWLLFSVTFGFVIYFWNKHRAEHSGTGLRFSRHRGDGRVEKTHPTELQSVE